MTLARSLRGRGLRLAALAVVAAMFVLGGAFLAGVEVSGEFLRAPLERVLSTAFKVPARIEGPLRLRTGRIATVAADSLVLADPSAARGLTLARALEPSARIDLLALLRRAVALDEVTSTRLELALARDADGRANWTPLFGTARDGRGSTLSFEGIARLRIGTVGGSYQHEGAAPVPFTLSNVDATLPRHAAITARGIAKIADQQVAFDLRSASLAALVGSGADYPLQGTMQWAAVSASIDGKLARDGSHFDADVEATADDAAPMLAALGVAADRPGQLALRMQLGVTAAEAVARDIALALGRSVVSGRASVAWSASTWRIDADLVGERIDLAPFALTKPLPEAANVPEAFVDFLDRVAADADAQIRLVLGELAGLPVAARELKFDVRSGDRIVAGKGSVVLAGARVDARFDYDARQPRRSLAAEISSGGVASDELGGVGLPREVSGSAAGIRGRLKAQGETARDLIAAVDATLEARDLRWAVDLERGPLGGQFDNLRVAVQGARASSVEISGKLGDAACSLRIAGGALAPLLDGEPWPLQATGACPNARLGAKGRLALARGRIVGNLEFDAAADRVDRLAQALGVGSTLPGPVAARGTLVLDERFARAQFAALRAGRSQGAGEIALPRVAGAAARVQLVLAMLDLDEFVALAERAPQAALPTGSTRPDARLPDLDFTLAVDRIALAGASLRALQFAGKVRARQLPSAPFRLDWGGISVGGTFGADFSGAVPSFELDARANDADLRAVLTLLGVEQAMLRAGKVTLQARARGATPEEMLAGATVDAAIEDGRLDVARGGKAGGALVRSDFSATLRAAPGQLARLSARGSLDGESMELAVEADLAALQRNDAPAPLALQMAIGDARAEASGKVSRDGTGAGRLQVSGGQLDRLGTLIGVPLPREGPYSAGGSVAVSPDVIRVGDLAVEVGRSRAAGEVRFERRRGGRPRYVARLRVPSAHLEDLGADQWLRRGARAGEGPTASVARPAASESWRGLDLLHAADIEATIDVEALQAAGERIGGGRLLVAVDAGVLLARWHGTQPRSGGLDADLRVDANDSPPKLALRAQARGFEYGRLARSLDPATTTVGTLDLDADLAAQWPPGNLLRTMSGAVDVAIYPRGLRSRALALWGVGFLPAILGQLDPNERSVVECAVSSYDVAGGVARSTAFFVDSTRVRVVGEVEVDLATRALSGRIDPRSKDPALLTLAPTMLLGGTVDSPRVTSAPANIVTVPLRLGASVADFARGWLGARGKDGDGAPGCREAFEKIRQARLPTK